MEHYAIVDDVFDITIEHLTVYRSRRGASQHVRRRLRIPGVSTSRDVEPNEHMIERPHVSVVLAKTADTSAESLACVLRDSCDSTRRVSCAVDRDSAVPIHRILRKFLPASLRFLIDFKSYPQVVFSTVTLSVLYVLYVAACKFVSI